jgi:hypothetical protein
MRRTTSLLVPSRPRENATHLTESLFGRAQKSRGKMGEPGSRRFNDWGGPHSSAAARLALECGFAARAGRMVPAEAPDRVPTPRPANERAADTREFAPVAAPPAVGWAQGVGAVQPRPARLRIASPALALRKVTAGNSRNRLQFARLGTRAWTLRWAGRTRYRQDAFVRLAGKRKVRGGSGSEVKSRAKFASAWCTNAHTKGGRGRVRLQPAGSPPRGRNRDWVAAEADSTARPDFAQRRGGPRGPSRPRGQVPTQRQEIGHARAVQPRAIPRTKRRRQ